MAVHKVFLLGCFLFVASAVNAASKDEILHTSLYRLAEGHIEKNSNRPSSSLQTRKTTTKPILTRATTLKPVYIPPSSTVKLTTKSKTEEVVEESAKSTVSEQPIITRGHDPALLDPMSYSNLTKERIVESLNSDVLVEEHVKSEANPKHKETAHTTIQPADQREPNQNEIAQEKSAIFGSASLVPLLASIGTALAIGSIAYYAYPVPELTARSDRLNTGSFDNGVRIVQSTDLTPQEIRRLMNAGAYHASARSNTDEKKPHPYVDLAKRVIQYATPVYQYLAPSFLGGNSDEEDPENEYDIGSIQSKQPFVGPGHTNRLIQPIYNGGQQNIGQHFLGHPNIGQANIGSHIIGQPNFGQHVLAQPNFGQHIQGQQNIGPPNFGQHVFRQANVGQHVLGQQNIVQPNVAELHYNN